MVRYDIKEFNTGNGVVRYRCWDSCMYSEFTRMAHGNNRLTQKERFRQRFMHKLVYYPENNDGRLVILTSHTEQELFYAAVSFIDDYIPRYAKQHGSNRMPDLIFDAPLTVCSYTDVPDHKTRSVFTWGHSINDYRAYLDNMARLKLNELQWDIGLAPMPQTEFHSCKHYNKFIEYAASAVAGIYSRVEPYSRLEKWEGFGLFSSNDATDWYNNIKSLIDNRDRMEAVRKKACEYASGPLSVEYIARQFYKDLNGYAADTREKSVRIILLPYKICHFIVRAYSFFLANRKNLIPAIVQKIKYFAGLA